MLCKIFAREPYPSEHLDVRTGTEISSRQSKDRLTDMLLNGARILVVEDDPAVSAFIKRVLQFEGATVSAAATGLDAIALVRTEGPYHLALLDLCLPDIHGWEVLDRIREIHPIASDCPVAVLTAGIDEENQRRAAANNVGFIGKPIGAADLAKAVSGFLI
jgi:CheY-like chemotaxis protein